MGGVLGETGGLFTERERARGRHLAVAGDRHFRFTR